MPTKRLAKLAADTQLTETKENISGALLLNKERMTRKRSRSDPGDPTNATTVLRLSQEANNPATDDHVGNKEDTESEDSNSRHVSSARLYAQSLQKANARKLGNSKRIKISLANNSVLDQLLSQGSKVVTTSFSEQSISQGSGHGHRMASASTDVTVSGVELLGVTVMKTKIIIRLMLFIYLFKM